MEEIFQLLDCDYVLLNGLPIIRLFGKTREGKSICAFYDKFSPYFYVLPVDENSTDEIVKEIKSNFASDCMKLEHVKKFLPLGFQSKPATMLKVVLKDPSRTPEIRDFLRSKQFVKEVYEADILFKYRFMADLGINGMRWIRVTGTPTKTSTVKVNKVIIAEKIEMTEDIDNAQLKYLGIDIEVATDMSNPVNGNGTDFAKEPISIVSLSFYPAYKGKNTAVLVAKQVRNHKNNSNDDVQTFSNESEMLEELLEIIESYDPDIMVGYNSNNFDFPYMNERMKKLKLPRLMGRCSSKPIMTQKIGENKFRNSITGRIVVDPYWMIREMIRGGGLTKYFAGLKRYGLGDVAKFFLGEDKIDVAHSEISKFWNGTDEQMSKLIDYSRKDAELVLKLLMEKGFLNKYIGVSVVSGVLLQDALDSGESTKVEHLLMREFNKANFVLPCRPFGTEVAKREKERETQGLKGALVLDPVTGFHNKCVAYLDFASMYPSIFISYNICPTTIILDGSDTLTPENVVKTPTGASFASKNIRHGIVPKTVEMLIKERAKVRSELPKEKDPTRRLALDAKQEALKRMTNSFYGYTGFLMSRVYMLDIANAVTGLGRHHIQKTKDIVEKDTPYKVIYGDTDSLMIKLDLADVGEAFTKGEELSALINSKLGTHLKLKVEYVFKSLIILAKKRYAGWSFEKIEGGWKEDITMKGIETVRRDWCDLVGETLNKVLRIILVDQKPNDALSYMKEVIQKLQNNEVEVEKLVITKGVSKRLEDYKGIQPHVEVVRKMKQRDASNAPGVGDRIGFVITKGTQLMSERAENPEYVRQHGMKIDSKYYVESQLLPPIERVFESMGIKREELLGVGRQMHLADMIKNGIKANGHKEEPLHHAEGLICARCNMSYRRAPLIGRCIFCNGELLFYSGESKSRLLLSAAA